MEAGFCDPASTLWFLDNKPRIPADPDIQDTDTGNDPSYGGALVDPT